MKPDAVWGAAPASGVLEVGDDVLDGAVVEDVAPRGLGGLGGGDDIAPAAVKGTLLGDQPATLEPHVAIAADKVNGAVNFGVLEVKLALVVVGVVGVLVGQQSHAVADGTGALVVQRGGASGSTGGIVVEGVLQGEVLKVVVGASVLDDGGLAESFVLEVGLVLDDGARHALSDEGDMMTGQSGEDTLAEVVEAVGNEDVELWGVLVSIKLVGLADDVEQALGVALLNDEDLLGAAVEHGHNAT